MELKHHATTTPELLEIYQSLLRKTIISYQSVNQYSYNDCRAHFYSCLTSEIETAVLLVDLLVENYPNISVIRNIEFQTEEEMNVFLNNKLSVIASNIRENLFQRIFLRFEGFARIIAKDQEKETYSLLDTLKKLILHLSLDSKYQDFATLLIYIRNTVHFEGYHTKDDININYAGVEYQFLQGKPLAFFNIKFLAFLVEEIDHFALAIINSDIISKRAFIEHTSTGIINVFLD
ncbi:hypothetical protein [Chryseobacterium arthrosphaerae]|uniref:hypothetical protein n=1 Tax=Chryseobacterium arthrosphaerae TaxID=651561 RepID=UPI001E4DB756|nr:hypothetical protein [Chryseobacterium arthrosphaerae]UEQ75251.1 hypothetical protein J8N07_16515 [Chryseobacterium arthrosphaerae]